MSDRIEIDGIEVPCDKSKLEDMRFLLLLGDIDDERFCEVLRPLLASKRRSTRAASDYELNGKLIRFAMGRGFTMQQIRQCLDNADVDDF